MQVRCSCGVIRGIKVIDPSIGKAELFPSVIDLGDGGIGLNVPAVPFLRNLNAFERNDRIGDGGVDGIRAGPRVGGRVSANPSRLAARALILASFVVRNGKPVIDALGRILVALPRERRSAGNYVVSVQRCRHRRSNCPICASGRLKIVDLSGEAGIGKFTGLPIAHDYLKVGRPTHAKSPRWPLHN
jgi:hypothetical protein